MVGAGLRGQGRCNGKAGEGMFEKYIDMALERGAAEVQVIDPHEVVTAAFVQHKCRYGCDRYGMSRCCPPHTPTWRETRDILDCYTKGLLIRDPGWGTTAMVGEIGHELFFDGYYKVVGFGAGFCQLCKECSMDACPNRRMALPSMEACGIDVFATAHAFGMPCEVGESLAAPHNAYGLVCIE